MKKPKKIKMKKSKKVEQLVQVVVQPKPTSTVPAFEDLSITDRLSIVKAIDPKTLVLQSSYGQLEAMANQMFSEDERRKEEKLKTARKIFKAGIDYIEKMPAKFGEKENAVALALKNESYPARAGFIAAGPNGVVPDSTFIENFCYSILTQPWNIFPTPYDFNNHHNVNFMMSWDGKTKEPILSPQYQALEAKSMYYHQLVKKVDGVGIFKKLPMTRAVYEGDRIEYKDDKVVITKPAFNPKERPLEIIGYITTWELVDGYADYDYSDVARLAKVRFSKKNFVNEKKKDGSIVAVSERDMAVRIAAARLYSEFWKFANRLPLHANESQERMMRKTALIGAYTTKLNSVIHSYSATLGFDTDISCSVEYKAKCPITQQRIIAHLKEKEQKQIEGEV